MRKVTSLDIGKITGRKGIQVDKYRSNVYYDPNVDFVKPNAAKVVPDFKRFTCRKDPVFKSYNQGFIDDEKVL